MKIRSRRASGRPMPEEERRRLAEAFWRDEMAPGPELLARLGRALGRGYKTLAQFPFEGAPSPVSAFGMAGDEPAWDGPFLWTRGRLIYPVKCRLLIRPPDGGPLIAVACRRRYVRGDPPVDVDMLEEEMNCAVSPDWEVDLLDGSFRPVKPPDAPPEPAPLQMMLEFCAASATHSGQPLLVSREFNKAEGTRAMRTLAREVRRVQQGQGQPVPPPVPPDQKPAVPPDQKPAFDDGFDDPEFWAELNAKVHANPWPDKAECGTPRGTAFPPAASDDFSQPDRLHDVLCREGAPGAGTPGENRQKEDSMQTWTTRAVIPISTARDAREAQTRRREERLADVSDAVTAVADILVSRTPALEAQTQLHLDFYTLEVRLPGTGGAITLAFHLIDPLLADIDLSGHTEAGRKDIKYSYNWYHCPEPDGDLIGPDRPRMTIEAAGHGEVAVEVCPMTFHNPHLPAEEELDDFLVAVEHLVQQAADS